MHSFKHCEGEVHKRSMCSRRVSSLSCYGDYWSHLWRCDEVRLKARRFLLRYSYFVVLSPRSKGGTLRSNIALNFIGHHAQSVQRGGMFSLKDGEGLKPERSRIKATADGRYDKVLTWEETRPPFKTPTVSPPSLLLPTCHSLALRFRILLSFLLRMHSWRTTPKIIVMKIPAPVPKGSSCR